MSRLADMIAVHRCAPDCGHVVVSLADMEGEEFAAASVDPALARKLAGDLLRLAGDFQNLITACFDCNRGKGAIPLSDRMTREEIEDQRERVRERIEQAQAFCGVCWRKIEQRGTR